MRSFVLKQILEQCQAFAERHVFLERADNGIAVPALSAELLSLRQELLSDRDRRAHMQTLPAADAFVNEKRISGAGRDAMNGIPYPV
jgi:hypothetical protein